MPRQTRRMFLKQCTTVAVSSFPAALFMSGCAGSNLPLYYYARSGKLVSLDVARYPELQVVENAIQLEVKDLPSPIVIVRMKENGFVALSPICGHLGCTVRKDQSQFRCPCHGSTYSLDGAVVRGPSERSLTVYRSEFSNGILSIQL